VSAFHLLARCLSLSCFCFTCPLRLSLLRSSRSIDLKVASLISLTPKSAKGASTNLRAIGIFLPGMNIVRMRRIGRLFPSNESYERAGLDVDHLESGLFNHVEQNAWPEEMKMARAKEFPPVIVDQVIGAIEI